MATAVQPDCCHPQRPGPRRKGAGSDWPLMPKVEAIPRILQQPSLLPAGPAGWSWLRLASMEPRGKDVSEATACVPLTSPCTPPTSRIQKLPHQVPLCHKIFYWKKKNHRLRKRGVGAPATSVCLGAVSGRGGLRRAAGSPTRGSACVPGGVRARGPARGEWGVQERSGA